MLFLLTYFYRFLVQIIATERHTHREVAEARAMLEQYSLTLEEKVNQRTAELASAMQGAQETHG